MKGESLLSIENLDRKFIEAILQHAESFLEVLRRPIPVVPALRGVTVATMFFEDSTRTRISFELAARRLSAEVINFSARSSSLSKGESLKDTVETLALMGADVLIVRHSCAAVPHAVSRWASLPVINAGDGCHEHPTQALVDLFTVRQRVGDLAGKQLTIVGDIEHSRVARSNIWLFTKMGAKVTLVAPSTLLPLGVDSWPVEVADHLDDVLGETDVLMLLRLQRERGSGVRIPSLREYQMRYGLDEKRASILADGAWVLHPGPVNRDIELAPSLAAMPNVLVGEQVSNGVAVRMAALYSLVGGVEGE